MRYRNERSSTKRQKLLQYNEKIDKKSEAIALKEIIRKFFFTSFTEDK